MITNKLDYNKIIIDVLEEKKVEFHKYQSRRQRAYIVVNRNLHHSVQQDLLREDIERMGHKIRNLWSIRHKITGCPFSLFFLDIEPAANNNEIYHIKYLQNMAAQIQPPHQKQDVSSILPYQGVLRTQTEIREMWQVTKHPTIYSTRVTTSKMPTLWGTASG
jgi:hypothetical protein